MNCDLNIKFGSINYEYYDIGDPEAQKLCDEIYINSMEAFREELQERILKYRSVLKGCSIEFLLDFKSKDFKPVINLLFVPPDKEKIVRYALSIIKHDKGDPLIIRRQKSQN